MSAIKSHDGKKYAFTGEVKQVDGHELKRIRRLYDGLIGGWIEHEGNLSQEGTCFVYDEACVSGEARVYGRAQVYGRARVTGEAHVWGKARVYGKARVWGEAYVYGKAQVSGKAWVSGKAQVSGEARVYGHARVYNEARVYKDAEVEHCLYLQQPKHDITATDTHVFIGCEGHAWQHWFEHVHEIGKRHVYIKQERLDVLELLAGLEECLEYV